MALFIPGKSTCPLCNRVLTEQDERFGTWGVFPVPPDLFPYCDAVMHWSCYAAGFSVQKNPRPKEAGAGIARRRLGVEEACSLARKVFKDGRHCLDDAPSPVANFLAKAPRNLTGADRSGL